MIVRSFKSVMGVAAVAGAALSCYMVSLRVASERASLERIESRILMAKRDIRSLDTELGTRGRIRQLERWNTDVLALAAPTEAQFLESDDQLARLTRVDPVEPAPVMMAAAIVEPDGGNGDEARPRSVLATYRPQERPARLVRASAPEPAIETRTAAKPERKLTAKAKVAAKAKVTAKAEAAAPPKLKVRAKAEARAEPAAKVKVAARAPAAGKAKPGKGL